MIFTQSTATGFLLSCLSPVRIGRCFNDDRAAAVARHQNILTAAGPLWNGRFDRGQFFSSRIVLPGAGTAASAVVVRRQGAAKRLRLRLRVKRALVECVDEWGRAGAGEEDQDAED